MKNFVRLNITDRNILDEVSFFVKCHVDFIWLVVPDDFPKTHLVEDILAICEGETDLWVQSNNDISDEIEINGRIHYSIPENQNKDWAGVASNLADFKNMELAGAKFILIDYHNIFNQGKESILGSEGLHSIFEDESYGWSILTVNTPIYVYGKLSKAQSLTLHDSKFVGGYEIN